MTTDQSTTGGLISRLLNNARFLDRKGWSKSAVLEQEAAAEIERLGLALTASENDAAADRRRLAFIREFLDGLGGIDLHERAFEYAEKAGKDEADDGDYLAATRDALDSEIGRNNGR